MYLRPRIDGQRLSGRKTPSYILMMMHDLFVMRRIASCRNWGRRLSDDHAKDDADNNNRGHEEKEEDRIHPRT